jgi:rhodanese-related sulfurtransferase
MDTVAPALPVSRLLPHIGSAQSPLVLDVRRAEALAQDDALVAGAAWRDPFDVAAWARFLPRHRSVVVYCVHGHEISRNTAQALRAAGIDASYLEGGIEAWRAAKGPTTRKSGTPAIPSALNAPSTWVTRERPKVDRIACPWLVRRFIDPFAEFEYVAADTVAATAQARGWIPYDVPGVRFTHRGERCSFDALVEDFGLDDAPLHRLALIVRGADTAQPQLAPQSAGLVALSLGLSATFPDDHAMLQHGLVMYDALYAWCRQEEAGTAERHTWKAPA